MDAEEHPFVIPGLGLALALVSVTLLGWLSSGFLGRFFVHAVERRLFARLPVVRSLYRTSKQVTETILSERGRAFRKVVVLRYPHEKSWSVAFGSAPPPPEIRQHLGEDCETFFLPAVPNPTTGFLLFAEPGQWRDTEMGMEEALKFIVSGGILRRAEGAHRKRTDEGRFGRWAQRGFLRGLLIGVPVFVTLWLCWRVAAFVDDLLRPLVPQSLLPANRGLSSRRRGSCSHLLRCCS